jgi:hypothetical protein
MAAIELIQKVIDPHVRTEVRPDREYHISSVKMPWPA